MSDGQSNQSESDTPDGETAVDDWPTFGLRYTFNPDRNRTLDPDEVFVFDPEGFAENQGRWISAKRDSYVAVENVR